MRQNLTSNASGYVTPQPQTPHPPPPPPREIREMLLREIVGPEFDILRCNQ